MRFLTLTHLTGVSALLAAFALAPAAQAQTPSFGATLVGDAAFEIEDGSPTATTALLGGVDCNAEPGIIIQDDGTPNDGYTANPGTVTSVTLVDRFTPTSYPATFTQVCVSFITTTGGPSEQGYAIRVYDDDGAGGSPGTLLGGAHALATGIPESSPGVPIPVVFQTADISGLGLNITEGSVYIGVNFVPGSPNIYVTADQSPTRPAGFAGGYFGTASGGGPVAFSPMTNTFPSYRALFIRAVQGAAVATEGGPDRPAGVTLYRNAPNPVGSETTIRYSLAEASDIRIALYDVTGREVAVIAEEARPAGPGTAALDASGLPGGVYVVRLTAGGASASQTVTVGR